MQHGHQVTRGLRHRAQLPERHAGLRAAGAATVERDGDSGIIVHPKTGDRFPVRFVRWDATKQRMANLSANNPALAGEFTEETIDQVRALEDEALFNELQLDKLLAAEEAKACALPSEFPEFDESAADDVKFVECPACGHKFPK